jgi:hypothetical protein
MGRTPELRARRTRRPLRPANSLERRAPFAHPIQADVTRVTAYMDPYGRFFLSDRRGGYPVDVEFGDGYRVLEDRGGERAVVGPEGAITEITQALRLGVARIVSPLGR